MENPYSEADTTSSQRPSDVRELIAQILQNEIAIDTARSSGPGWQNVNKTESKVMGSRAPEDSKLLSDEQKTHILAKLRSRITKDGLIRIAAQDSRSQLTNKDLVHEKFAALIEEAFKEQKPRKVTKVPRSVVEARINEKKKRGETKAQRRGGDF